MPLHVSKRDIREGQSLLRGRPHRGGHPPRHMQPGLLLLQGLAGRREGREVPRDEGRHGRVPQERDEPLPLPGQIRGSVPLRLDHVFPDVQAEQGK